MKRVLCYDILINVLFILMSSNSLQGAPEFLYSDLVPNHFIHSYISNYDIYFEPKILHLLISYDQGLHTEFDTVNYLDAYENIKARIKILLDKLMREKNAETREEYHAQKSFLRALQGYLEKNYSITSPHKPRTYNPSPREVHETVARKRNLGTIIEVF